MRHSALYSFLAVTLLTLTACSQVISQTSGSDDLHVKQSDTELVLPSEVPNYTNLSAKSDYYAYERSLSEEERHTYFDENGLAVTLYDDKRVFHPVDSVWKLMVAVDSYETTHNPQDWDLLEKNLAYAIEHSQVDENGARWFVYTFDHSHKDMHMRAPWVSGMSQGMMLSLISRMNDSHPSKQLRTWADEIFTSFLAPRTPGKFWITNPVPCPDDAQLSCTFLEEYPLDDHETHVVNGHIYAMLGLHDYYRMSKNPDAKRLFEEAGFAILHSFNTYRIPGAASWYAVADFGKETWGTPTNYHAGVIPELEALTKITGDPLYRMQADVLRSDFSE